MALVSELACAMIASRSKSGMPEARVARRLTPVRNHNGDVIAHRRGNAAHARIGFLEIEREALTRHVHEFGFECL
jgi:hypothetical protein